MKTQTCKRHIDATNKGETQMKRINHLIRKLASIAPKAAPLAILFACFALGSGNLFAQCETGSVILDSSGNFAGCAYSTWGTTEQGMCSYLAQYKNATVFGPASSAGCHACVLPPYDQQVSKGNYSGLTLKPYWELSGGPPFDAPTTFRCLKCVTPPAGLVAWWPLDELTGDPSALDVTRDTNSGVRYGTTSVPGEVGNAAKFDGVADHIDVFSPLLDIGAGAAANGSGDFSIDAWVKIDPGTDSSGVRVIVEKRTFSPPSHYKGYSFYLYKRFGSAAMDSGYLGLQLADDGAAPGYANYGAPALFVPADGVWHFVAVSVARNPKVFNVQFTLDNNAVVNVSAPIRSGDLTNASPLRIGMATIGGNYAAFDGTIDEVEFFNRAVSVNEFQSIFNAKCDGKCPVTPVGIGVN